MRQPNGKRGRSRGRKGGHNQLNRTLESNGPDVKIRGSAAHIHEKYLALARDANSAGDRVGAENYLQHAEHYHRLMMAAMPQGQPMPYQNQHNQFNGGDDEGSEESGAELETGEALPPQYQPQHQNQAREQREPRETRESSGERDRRLNGRSRRVNPDERNGRATPAPERSEEAPPSGSDAASDTDEAMA